MPLDRMVTDSLLARDEDLRHIDPDRFHLDLSEIADEAAKISSLPLDGQSATDLLTTLSGSVAHMISHWESLIALTGWEDAKEELLRVYRSVNRPTRSRWPWSRHSR